MWKILNSRRVAVYLLCLFLALLVGSAFVPSPYTFSPEEWQWLQRQNGPAFWVYSHLSTPFMVKNPLFAGISTLLFLSTLVCTVDRGRLWWSSRSYEFSKEKAFSFAVAVTTARPPEAVLAEAGSLFAAARWSTGVERSGEITLFSGQKGMSGFWGSMVFHLGLLVCFLAAPVTLASGFSDELTLVEDEQVVASSAMTAPEAGAKTALGAAQVKVKELRGRYYQGQFRYDFGGRLTIDDGKGASDFPFAVNHPVSYRGFQFSLSSFGHAPHLVIAAGGNPFVDNYVRVSGNERENYFDLPQGLRAFVLFFPDFYREGGKIGTRSKDPVNPVILVKLFQGEREVFKSLFRPGEQQIWNEMRIGIPDYRHWVTFTVTREYGIFLVMAGFVLVVGGLFARFLSNERRVELEIRPLAEGTACQVRGYSRYYPAFLEKEVLQIAERIKGA